MSQRLVVKDTTFRDGVQGQGVEATDLKETLTAIQAIDSLGVSYHEVGFAVASAAIRERIRAAMELELLGKIAAFGRTHPLDVQTMLDLKVPVAVLVGKSRAHDVIEVIRQATLEDNLKLISDSIGAMVQSGVEVIYDAEHLFQACLEDDQAYALQTLEVALQAGASRIVLCDTNGKMSPHHIAKVITLVKEVIPVDRLGIHTHNDRGRAVVNAEAAFMNGVPLVEGTIGGVGERTGNLDLCTVVPNLVREFGAEGISPEQLARMTEVYFLVCDVLNVTPNTSAPWVGSGAWYSEAGMHESGNARSKGNYLHDDPAVVGNRVRVGVTDQSGKANIISKAGELGVDIPKDKIDAVAKAYQSLVDNGGDFGMADASFYLFLLRQLGQLPNFFEFVSFRVITDKSADSEVATEASLRFFFNGERKFHNADGDGPVNALDEVLRRTLRPDFPELMSVRLDDYKVRIVDAWRGTAAKIRVKIEFTDGVKTWTTVAVNENIIEASWDALLDAYIYKLVTNDHSTIQECSAALAKAATQ